VILEGGQLSSISLLLQGKLDVYLSSAAKPSGGAVAYDKLKHTCYRLLTPVRTFL
jgi:hypothetical protein